MNANVATEIIFNNSVQNIPASTAAVVSKSASVTSGGAARSRVDIFVGKVAGTVDLLTQHSSGLNLWVDAKATTVGASTDIAVTAATTDIITATGHGLVDGDAVMVNASSMPGGLSASQVYYVLYLTANTFKLANQMGGTPVDITSTGTSVTVTKVTVVSIAFNPETAGDISGGFIPLRPSLRVKATTGAAESIQIASIKLSQEL